MQKSLALGCRLLHGSSRVLVFATKPCQPRKLACFCSTTPPTSQEPASPTPANNTNNPQARPATPRPRPGPPMMRGPDGKPLQVVQIEKAGDEAWAGVAAIDREDERSSTSGRVPLLIAGDAVMILAFAVAGRINHGEVLDVETLSTALPFLVGWFASATLLGGFGKEASGSSTSAAALVAVKCWAVGTPLGLVLRGLQKGYVPPKPFIIVSLVATAVLLVGWRSALAATTPEEKPSTPAQKAAARKNKQGNPFEFLQLLFSLVKRW